MSLYALPPVRRAVPLRRGDARARLAMKEFFGNRRITLYSSGTAALAQAMINCALRSSVETPEVIIPAYGCPDLVTACVHARVYPRLVDVALSDWSYDLEALQSGLSSNTVAIVGVNLLGLGDRAAELSRLCKERHIPLIQDSAQYLPRESIDWPGDYVVLSFGRGKPLNLLHGGALVSPLADRDSLPALTPHYTTRARLLSSRAAAIAFNTLTRPTIYRMFSALPGTGVGDVVYKPVTNPAPLPERSWQRVAGAFELYCRKPSYRRDIWAAALAEWSDFGIAAFACGDLPPPAEPLRLALLAPDLAERNILVDNLSRAGLGASRFYGADLTGVAAIPTIVRQQAPFPNASSIANRLFTLPTHDLVSADAIRTTRELVFAWYRHSRTRPS